jgi:hypothetical protein
LVVLLILVIALHTTPSKGPPLATSCTTPAIALGSATTGSGRGIGYAITGPKVGTYLITVDASAATVHGDSATVTPHGAIAIALHDGLKTCAAHGILPALGSGAHQVQLFRDGTIVAKADLG